MWDSYMLDFNLRYAYNGEVKKHSKRVESKIERFTAHCLRHTFATLLYIAGVDILTAMNQLGHKDVKTTLGIYTHLDEVYKRNSMDRLNSYLCKYDASEENDKITLKRGKMNV